jgi:hypothetical protein
VIFASAGFVFGLTAEYIWLKTIFLPEVAALAVSGSAFALALIFAATGKFRARQKKTHPPAGHITDIAQVIGMIVDSLGKELQDPIHDNPKTALMLAGMAGYAAGQRHI